MNKFLADLLVEELRVACPIDTGQLKKSIQLLQVNAKDWVVTIGDENSSIRGVPSNAYASYTNFVRRYSTYHWVNRAIKRWAVNNALQFNVDIDEDEDYEQI